MSGWSPTYHLLRARAKIENFPQLKCDASELQDCLQQLQRVLDGGEVG